MSGDGEAMVPRLVVGLGNPAAGDDGVGWRVAERLATDARLPHDVDVLCGGADVLRLSAYLTGRRELLFVDACLGMPAGALELVDHAALVSASVSRPHAHHVSALDAVDLLLTVGELRAQRVRWALVGVEDVRHGDELTPALAARLADIVTGMLGALGESRA